MRRWVTASAERCALLLVVWARCSFYLLLFLVYPALLIQPACAVLLFDWCALVVGRSCVVRWLLLDTPRSRMHQPTGHCPNVVWRPSFCLIYICCCGHLPYLRSHHSVWSLAPCPNTPLLVRLLFFILLVLHSLCLCLVLRCTGPGIVVPDVTPICSRLPSETLPACHT